MKEIKAYIRVNMIDKVICTLEERAKRIRSTKK